MDFFSRNLSDYEYVINETVPEPESGSDKINDFGQRTFFETTMSLCIQLIFGGVLLTPVAVFGVLGNVLSIVVLSEKQMRSSLSVLLIGLSLCDAFVCLASILVIGLPALFKHFDVGSGFLDLMCLGKRFIFPIALTAQTGSTYFTVAVTFERYIAVCRPLQARSICTWERARYFTVAIIAISILSNIPRYISYSTKKEILHITNHTCQSYPSKTSKSTDYISFLVYSVFMYLIPICTVVVVNCIIIRMIRQQNTNRDTLSSQQLTEMKLTNMLIAVVAVYVFCNIFRLFNAFTKIIFGYIYAELASFTNFLVTLNSAVDFLIYCAFGRIFRESCVHLFCKCCVCAGSSTRSLSLQGSNKSQCRCLPMAESGLSDSVLVKNLRRFSTEVTTFVGFPRTQEHNVNVNA